jgi:hypothetical protein
MIEALKIIGLCFLAIVFVYGGFVLIFNIGQKIIDGIAALLRRIRTPRKSN